MRVPRWVSGILIVALMLVVSASAVAQSPAPSPTPPAASTYYVIRAAVDGLAALDAFAYRSTQIVENEAPVESVMEVRRRPVPSVRFQLIGEGEIAYETISIDRQAWSRSMGAPWAPDDGETDTGMQLATGIWPVEPRLLLDLFHAGIEMARVGTEDVDGRPTVRYGGELPDDATAEVTGTLELWVDAERGFLVRAEADVLDRGTQAMIRAADSVRVRETIEVSRVDDPRLRIDPPDLAAGPTPAADGDPALAPVVEAAFTRLADHATYRAAIETRTPGSSTVVEIEAITSPELRVHGIVRVAAGNAFMEILAVGDRVWTRAWGDERWSAMDSTVACVPGACSASSYVDFGRTIEGQSGTFELVAEDEAIDGRPVTHLRSVAGFAAITPDLVPGTVDLWVDRDGGHLVKLILDGQGIAQTITIRDLDDPSIVIEPPGDHELAPPATPVVIGMDTESPPPSPGG